MKFRIFSFIAITTLIFSCEQKTTQTEIADIIESRIKDIGNESLVNAYIENDFKPIWVQRGGMKAQGENFVEALEEIEFDGLEKTDYFTKEQSLLVDELRKSEDAAALADLDIELSTSFLTLASDLNIGKVDPSKINIEWKMERKSPTVEYQEVLLSIAQGESVSDVLNELRPENPRYQELRTILEELISNPVKETETQTVLSFEGKIEPGVTHNAIPIIRQKLSMWDSEISRPEEDAKIYSEELVPVVKDFQKRHGLIDDGIIGEDFIEAINYSQSDLITKLKVNLERMRWLPDFTDTEKNKVIVNIPDYRFFYIQGGDTILTSRVVVGKDYRQTPVFQSEMTYLVFSPTWTLPETILWEDAIPSIQKDLGYLAENNMKVLDFDENEVNPKKIDWDKLEDKEDFPYMIRQSPGLENPLGQVKFMFPNDYSIYIHDSPAKSLFSVDERTFSSGCIRMEKPLEFATLLLEEKEGWDEEEISESMNLEEEKNVSLEESQEVWILYLSVWKNGNQPDVRKDIYGMDKKLAEAMNLPVSKYFL